MLAAALFCATAVVACRPQQPAEPETDNLVATEAQSPLPVADPPFDRARLLLAVARAASSHVIGSNDLDAQRKLDGKQFEVRLRFGCDGQGPGHGDHGWSVDPDGRALRLRAVPNISMEDELVQGVAGAGVEAAEGFWLDQPWLLHAACPAPAPTPETPDSPQASTEAAGPASPPRPESPYRIGIAQFFTAEDPRTGRRIDRPFEAVQQLSQGEPVGAQGFDLILSGRLRSHAGGRVILCSGSGRHRPPDCIVSANVDRVRIERPDDKAVMAEWSI